MHDVSSLVKSYCEWCDDLAQDEFYDEQQDLCFCSKECADKFYIAQAYAEELTETEED